MHQIEHRAGPGRTVRLHVSPPCASPPGPAPAAIFFHGGGWVKGDWTQFLPQADRLTGLGMLAILVEYRRLGPVQATEDAILAMQGVAEHAAELGVDPERIVAIGGSAGGQLALATALLARADRGRSVRPAALALLNPVTDTTGEFPVGFGRRRFDSDEQARRHSPLHHVRAGNPPMLIMHGTADTAVHHHNSVVFADAVRQHGGRCDLSLYDGQRHGFFNRRSSTAAGADTSADVQFEKTTAEIIRFIRTVVSDRTVRSGYAPNRHGSTRTP